MFNIEDFNKHVTRFEIKGLTSFQCDKGCWSVPPQEHCDATIEAFHLFQKHFINGEYYPDLSKVPALTRFFNWLSI